VVTLSRRRFIAVTGGVVGAAVSLDALAIEPAKVALSRHEVLVPRLPRSFDGLRIAHITDVHFPGNTRAAQAALKHLRREQPEIVVLTGDMLERPEAFPKLAEFSRAARGSLATVATLGNWEYYAESVSTLPDLYREAGVDLLVNEHREIRIGGSSIALVGLDDLVEGKPNIHRARTGLQGDVPEIWLVHAPGFASAPPPGVSVSPALLLAGHTHGGQVRLPFVPAVTPPGSGRFVAGWYRDTFAPLYVSRGIGTTTIPVRFACPPELPIFTLRAV
jgi:predicted MPP superfamily phosphohydrolase